MSFFATKWRQMGYKVAPKEVQNGDKRTKNGA